MKSRIPQAKAGHSQNAERPSLRSTSDLSTVHAALDLLGAPTIEEEEFNRLYSGPFADTLLFMSEHLKGRRQVAVDRHAIHKLREVRSQLHVKQPDDAARSPVDRSESSLNATKQTYEVLRRELVDRQTSLEKTQRNIDELNLKLQSKRRVALLLRVLEQKEKIRMQRFREMSKMMEDLRRSAKASHPQDMSTGSADSLFHSQELSPVLKLPRLSYTRDTITNIHAYHSRLSQISKVKVEPSSQVISRLEQIISARVESNQEAKIVLQRCVSAARARSAKVIQYRKLETLASISSEALDQRLARNRTKENNLQKLSDHTIALGFLCEHFLTTISVFLDQTSSILRSSLQDELPQAKGYIDILRLLVAASCHDELRRDGFIQDVGKACNIRASESSDIVLRDIENLLGRYRHQSSASASFANLHVPPPNADEEALIASHDKEFEGAEERATKLLARKVEKAGLGNSLVKDMETLLVEMKTIVGS
ncbi:hypothetical protein Hypma_005371 [Hypsizygus marmoreus]|uniref:Uncharacterized protein n=1 Tax=Hypsizygus marmoreus TaxID=39966 RepID=A0A369JYE3_HYPMA|nr:hypothetical protein Hypma_005371 [Hypsizygus marmoreus]